ncbi:MAG: 3-phosphoglycerate dehydrogenase [Ruminococcaceae bacterium]|nr:3-phosphoglycerate dehydrogenase [Oscillospiraceae bacterium]
MFDILTLNKIAACGLNQLDKADFNITDDAKNPDGIILRSFSMHDMELGDNLKAVARAGAGVNNIPIDKCSEKGIVVFNTPGANANAVKELVIAGLFLASRKVSDGIAWAKTLDGEGDNVGKLVEKGKGQFVGPEIMGKKLGVIGLGAIGVMVANTAAALGMDVEGYDPYISVDAAWKLNVNVKKAKDMKEIFETCDYITIHVPLNDGTRGMINKDTFAQMKDGVRILNFSRDALVNDNDMKEALESGKVACYVTDFPNQATLKMPNTVCIPHLGASTPESEDNCAVMAAKEINEFLLNGNIVNSVNFPNCSMPKEGVARVTIAHKNVPNCLTSFSNAFSKCSINIANMLNKSKGDYAYTIMDLDHEVTDEIIKELEGLDNVLKVRKIG